MNGRFVAKLASLGAIVALIAVGCSSTSEYQMESGERTVGAQGDVLVTVDDNENRMVELAVSHLPLPQDLHQQKSTYTVWVLPDSDEVGPQNAGRLVLDEDRHGFIKFTTPFRSFDLVVTAEPSELEAKPSDERVLFQEIDE